LPSMLSFPLNAGFSFYFNFNPFLLYLPGFLNAMTIP
jgi:hypothetical protein